ncbi:50S ribosomal protein L32 [Candidatus Dependentiae bacterium]|nr:50S ribosomal protein L32 [Candidatus Dependentiae bacterium]
MPVPKRKTSKSRRDKRSANKGLKVKSIAVCQSCQAPVVPHKVCSECGKYKGVKVLRTKTDRMHERGQVRRELEAKRQGQDVASETAVVPEGAKNE